MCKFQKSEESMVFTSAKRNWGDWGRGVGQRTVIVVRSCIKIKRKKKFLSSL